MLVSLGTISAPVAQWFLLWLFSRQGVESVGQLSTLLSVAAPVFVACSLGLRDLYLSLTAPVFWGTYRALRVSGSVVGAIVILAVGGWLQLDPLLSVGVAVLKVGDALLDLLYGELQQDRRMASLGAVMIFASFLTSAGAAAAWFMTGSGVIGLFVAAILRAPLVAWVAVVAAPHASKGGLRGVDGVLVLMKPALPVTINQLMASALTYIPVWLVALFAGVGAVGTWSAAAYLLVAANIGGVAIRTLILPSTRSAHESGGRMGLYRVVSKAAARTSWACVIGVLAVVAIGDQVLVHVYGVGFAIGPAVLVPMALASAMAPLSFIWNAAMLVRNSYIGQAVITLTSVALSALVGLGLGALGLNPLIAAAWASVAGGVVRLAGSWAEVAHATFRGIPFEVVTQ